MTDLGNRMASAVVVRFLCRVREEPCAVIPGRNGLGRAATNHLRGRSAASNGVVAAEYLPAACRGVGGCCRTSSPASLMLLRGSRVLLRWFKINQFAMKGFC
ncbi:hypothetical protein KCP70_22430 [Salmonella enterica subsp. enterica]|nr:hypothetical protein KCP70_22430 [Salmonella enterica subsp. enterica]